MFKDKTVFVVGAGASAEFGMPVGAALMDTIKQNCTYTVEFGRLSMKADLIGRHYLTKYNLNYSSQINELNARLNVMSDIVASIDMAESIDEYIYRRTDNPLVAEVGKLQIAHAISRAEFNSSLNPEKFDAGTRFVQANNAWIHTFAKVMMNGVRIDEVEKIGDNITIICFNYDRCIEHYLEHAIVRAYPGVTNDKAREIVNKINVVHPYGWLGPLGSYPFGNVHNFAAAAENLITWSESIRDPQIRERMSHAMNNAETVVFLGFAFARQNMDLLHAEEKGFDRTLRVFSTGFGLQQEAEEAYQENISLLYTPDLMERAMNLIRIQWDVKCASFMEKHRYNLAL